MGVLGIPLDPQDDRILEQKIAIPYVTTQPTGTPTSDGTRRIYFDSSNYFLYVYANGAWRSRLLDGSGSLPTDLNISGQQQGDIIYFDGTNWVRLAAGTSGYFLKTNGASANPAWAGQALSASTTSTTSVADGAGEITVATISVPGLGVKSGLMIHLDVGLSESSQAGDTLRLRIGSSLLLAFRVGNGTASNLLAQGYMFNSNSSSSQTCVMNGQMWQTFAQDNAAGLAIDTSATFSLNLTYQVTGGGLTKAVKPRVFTVEVVNV